jgi:hypothetical protein
MTSLDGQNPDRRLAYQHIIRKVGAEQGLRFVPFHDCSDCFRLERLPGGGHTLRCVTKLGGIVDLVPGLLPKDGRIISDERGH